MPYSTIYNQDDILKIIPHRPPFLFVESIHKFRVDAAISGTYVIKMDEYFFAGHFPDKPIMPGVIIIDALAQLSGLLWGFSEQVKHADGDDPPQTLFYLASTKMKFREPAYPGETLELHAAADGQFGRLYSYSVRAEIRRKPIVSGTIALAFIEQTITG